MASSVWIDMFGPFTYDGTTIIFPGNVQGERFLGADGTAALPTFSFYGSGDGDNGMYLSAADTLGFSAGGTLRLSVSSSAVTSTGPILPAVDATTDLGTPSFRWRDLYVQSGVVFSGDVSLSRGAANRLDLATGDSFYLVSGGLGVGVTPPSAGSVTGSGNGTFSAYTISDAASGYIQWTGRSVVKSPADGQANLTNQAQSAGVGFDFATDAIFKVRTRAQTGYATVDALAYQASGVAGISFSGAVTNITVVNGIVTAAS